jgi:hypothetical protein
LAPGGLVTDDDVSICRICHKNKTEVVGTYTLNKNFARKDDPARMLSEPIHYDFISKETDTGFKLRSIRGCRDCCDSVFQIQEFEELPFKIFQNTMNQLASDKPTIFGQKASDFKDIGVCKKFLLERAYLMTQIELWDLGLEYQWQKMKRPEKKLFEDIIWNKPTI